MEMKKIALLILAILLVNGAPAQALTAPGASIPRLSLPDTQGVQRFLPELMADKVTLLVYWSLTCSHCQKAVPQLLTINNSLAGMNNFRMLFVNCDGLYMAEATEEVSRMQNMPTPWLIDEGVDDSMPLLLALDISMSPSIFLYDVNGTLVRAQQSQFNYEELQQAILDYLTK